MTAPSKPSNCSPLSPYRQCCSGMIFGSSTAGPAGGRGIACRGKRGFVQQESWHLRALSGPKLVGLGAHPRSTKPSQNPFIRTETAGFWGAHPNRKTPLSGPKLVGYGAHLAPRHHRKTPLSGPKLVDSGVHTASQPLYAVHRKTPLSGPDSHWDIARI